MTDKPKHTRETWGWSSEGELVSRRDYDGGTELRRVVYVDHVGNICTTKESDKYLLAAAPDLIAALEDMIECVDVLERIWGNRVGKKDIWREAIMPVFCATNSYNKAKEAIKRAKGEES